MCANVPLMPNPLLLYIRLFVSLLDMFAFIKLKSLKVQNS